LGKSKDKGCPITCHWRHRRGHRAIAVPLLNLGTRWECMENALPWSLYPCERALCTEGRMASGPVWTGVENLALTGVSASNCPPCSKSLY